MDNIVKMPISTLLGDDEDEEFVSDPNSFTSYEETVEVSKTEQEKKDPFMTGLAIVCGAALVSSIVGGIVSAVNGAKVSKFLKSKQD